MEPSADSTRNPQYFRALSVQPPPLCHVCVLFLDIVDSTSLIEDLGLAAWLRVLESHHARAAELIEGFGGHIAQYLGDGLLAYFGFPASAEDAEMRAVEAGLWLIERARRAEASSKAGLRVRVGVHSGPVAIAELGGVGRREQLAVGAVPHVAARLQALAQPNTLFVSEEVHDRVRASFSCEPLGGLHLKGLSREILGYRVVSLRAASHQEGAPGDADDAGFVYPKRRLKQCVSARRSIEEVFVGPRRGKRKG